MNDFDALFPNFLRDCKALSDALLPLAFVLLAAGMISSTINGGRRPGEMLRTVGRTFVYAALLAWLVPWGNELSQITQHTVTNVLRADPTAVQSLYLEKLAASGGEQNEVSVWEAITSPQALFEAVASAALWLIAQLAAFLVTLAYIIQKLTLYLGYALAPIFIGFMAIRSLHGIGVNYLLALAGVIAWPMGWGAASIVTRGLLDFMVDQSFLTSGAAGAMLYSIQNLVGLALVALWIIVSTIAAPVLMQRALSSGSQIAQGLIQSAMTAASAGAGAGASAATTALAHGSSSAVGAAALGGLTGMAGTMESAATGNTWTPLSNTMTQMAGAPMPRSSKSQPKPHKDDPSGDIAVQELLHKTKS